MAKHSKYTKEQIVEALRMYVNLEPMQKIREKLKMDNIGWQSIIYFWRKKAGIEKRETGHHKWKDIRKEVEG